MTGNADVHFVQVERLFGPLSKRSHVLQLCRKLSSPGEAPEECGLSQIGKDGFGFASLVDATAQE